MLYILSTAEPDYGEEGILLAKRPIPADGDCALPDAQGPRSGRPRPSVAEDPAPTSTAPLIEGLGQRAELLLVAVSVYRTPFDRNAIAFQLGQHDWTAARAPDRRGPAPPYQLPSELADLLTECASAGMLLTLAGSQPEVGGCWQVEPWFASEVHARLTAAGRAAELASAHRRAAEYWQWRATAWPQDRRSDLNDLLEARYHLFSAGDSEQGSEITRVVCAQLHAWGDLGREAELIQSTLNMLPARSASRAAWLHELGAIHQVRGEHGEAYRCYAGAVQMFALLGDYGGVARGQHSLGVLAQAQGDYRRAERHYRRSGAADRRAAAVAAGTDPAGETGLAAETDTAGETGLAAETDTAGETGLAAETDTAAQPDPGEGATDPATAPAAAAPPPTTAALPAAAAPPATVALPGASALAALGQGLRRLGRVLRRRSVLLPAIIGLGLSALTIASIGAAMARTAADPPGGASGSASGGAAAGTGAAAAGRVRLAAAAWVASQVSGSAIVACDPAMCAALQERGVSAGDLLALGPAGPQDPLGSNVIVATAAVREEFGARLAAVYAPLVLARFGTGPGGIQVRAIAPDGAAAYRRAWRSELSARQQFGEQLLHNGHLEVFGPARAAVAAGRVDSRLLMTLATLADTETLRIVGFASAGPGAAAAVPLRTVEIGPESPAAGPGWAGAVLRFLAAQQPPFRPSWAGRARQAGPSQDVLIEFPSPSPLGLLAAAAASAGA
jgi:tetratricopeptide (TPR) repeat protein